jgi:hypothetical protein
MIILSVRQLPLRRALQPVAQVEHLVVKIISVPTLLPQAREVSVTLMAMQDTILLAHVRLIHNAQEALSLNIASAPMLRAPPATALLRPHEPVRVLVRLPLQAIGLPAPPIAPLQLQALAAHDPPQVVRLLRLIVHRNAV